MERSVIDASALLALLLGETGGEAVERHLPTASMSAVNFSEVLAQLIGKGIGAGAARNALDALQMDVVAFDADLAGVAAELAPATGRWGLSFGERACLALARQLGLPALTADRAWGRFEVGVEVRLIR